MINVLSQVQAPALSTSMMGSLYGAVRTWDPTLTPSDLFGYSGHAFILNIERTLCPSGPTAWDWGAILFPLRQLVSLRRICAQCDMRSAEEARELIWQRTVESIDAGRPAILWDVLAPEFYLACGYDTDTGEYLVYGPGSGNEPTRAPWSQLGYNTGQVWSIFPGPRETPNRTAARDLALRGATAWYRWPNAPDAQWTFGGDAWNVWIAAMREEEIAHNSQFVGLTHQVYAECRRHAAQFLADQGPAYAEAAAAFGRVADALDTLCAAWPCPGPVPGHAIRLQLAEQLTVARDAEAEGILALEALVNVDKAVAV